MTKRIRPPRTSRRASAAPTAAGKAASTRGRSRRARTPAPAVRAGSLSVQEVGELDDLRAELERIGSTPARWNADADDVQRSVAHLVLTLVEFIRKLLERQAIRRMEQGTLTDEQTEDVGQALMKLEETLHDIAAKFGIEPDELNLDLGPLGKLT